MKKYNTSLKFLIEDQPPYMLNEGMTRMSPISFTEQRAARCKLDIPDTYRRVLLKYITGVNSAYPQGGEAYTKQKVAKDKAREKEIDAAPAGGLTKIMNITQTFFGAAASEMLTPENFRTIIEFTNLFVMDSVPMVYCKALNRLFLMLEPLIKQFIEKEDDPSKETKEKISVSYNTAPLYEAYCQLVLLPKIFQTSDTYTNKINSYGIDFFSTSEGSNMKFSILFFKDFSKELISNDKFDVNFLRQDIQDFENIFRLPSFKKIKASSSVDAFESFTSAVEFDHSKLKNTAQTIEESLSKFDDENEDDAAAGASIKAKLKNEYLNHLKTTIEKIFYSPKLLNKISMPADCKTELDKFIKTLESNIER